MALTEDPSTVLHVHRPERADGLIEALRALPADPLADSFAAEVVAVPGRSFQTVTGATDPSGRISRLAACTVLDSSSLDLQGDPLS